MSISFIIIISCKKDEQIIIDDEPGQKSISGKVQKGPYKNGASLILYELNNSLGQTGRSFASSISDDAGSFALNNINLESNYVLITASGYYFNEHFNIVSEGQLYLEAIADVSNNSTVNVNLLTHIIRPRIEQLVNSGLDFNSSRIQAQNELLTVMGSNVGVSGNFENFDLSGNGFLFAMSLLFQRNSTLGWQMGYSYSAELSSLLSNFRNDFANNGTIDNMNIIDTLIYNVKRVDLIDCSVDMQNYYSGLGLNFSSNGFEQFIYNFQKKYTSILSNNIDYQDSSAIINDYPSSQLNYSYRENLLKPNRRIYTNGLYGNQFTLSAVVPYDSSLVVKLTAYNNPSPFSLDLSTIFGWKATKVNSTWVFEAQRKNISLSCLVYAVGLDSVKVEYFENSSLTTPFFIKNIIF